MTIVSTNVGLTDTATGTDFNNLRADVLENHIHDGTSGSTIDHTDLTHDGHSIVNEHEEIDEHIGAVKNVHGKGTTVGDEYIPGIVGGNLTFVAMSREIKWTNTELTSTHSITQSDRTFYFDFSDLVTFADSQYIVQLTPMASGSSEPLRYYVEGKDPTQFHVVVSTARSTDVPVDGMKFHILLIGTPERP